MTPPILSVTTAIGSTRTVTRTRFGLADCRGQLLGAADLPIRDERPATADERADWDRYVLTSQLADVVCARGAPAIGSLLRAVGGADRDDRLCDVILELRERGRDGLASQVAAFRFDGLPTEAP